VRFAYGETVTLVKTAIDPVPDDYGNDVLTKTNVTVPNCATWPRTAGNQMFTSEHMQGGDQVVVGLTLVMPPGTPVESTDQVIVRGDLYDVDGEPGIHGSPFTGFQAGIEMALKRAKG
jgi:hypothetical protein